MDYKKYLHSSTWKKKRKQILKRDNYQCQACDSINQGIYHKEDLEIHHRHYRHLGDEALEDLITLCPECHGAITNIHRGRRYRRKKNIRPSQLDAPKKTVPNEDIRQNDLANVRNKNRRGSASTSPQWAISRSIKSILERDEKDFFKKSKNGS